MADLDKQKEIVSLWKTSFFILLGTLFTLFGFLFNNFNKLPDIKLIIVNFVILLNVIILFLLARKLHKEIDRLKDL